MDESVRLILTSMFSAGGGAVLVRASDWFFSRGDRKAERDAKAIADKAERERQQAERERQQAEANDQLATLLRNEMRTDNLALRERLSTLEGQVIELNRTNESLRKENLRLTEQNGKQAFQLATQAAQLDAQAAKIAAMETALANMRDHNAALESALKTAKIPVPDLRRRTTDTGPLADPAA